MPLLVYDSRFSVKYVGKFVTIDSVHHLLQRVVFVKAVACDQKAELVAAGEGNSFVHGVIQSLVRFADNSMYPWAVSVDDR